MINKTDYMYVRRCAICGEEFGETNTLSFSFTLSEQICDECKNAIKKLKEAIREGKINR